MSLWDDTFGKDNQPTDSDTEKFINSIYWKDLNAYITGNFNVKPNQNYSTCPMQRGWNYKYKLKGRALCTLYPEKGYFTALAVIGEREENAVKPVLPLMSRYTQNLYENTAALGKMGRWLMIKVTDSDILRDVKEFIAIKAGIN